MPPRALRLVIVEPDNTKRKVLAERLQCQGFLVDAFGDPAEAANAALGNPPDAIVADVWMNGVSGVQLCRLFRSEPATETLPIILRAEGNTPKDRFWAEQAGANAFVPKGRIGDLVRAVQSAVAAAPNPDGFFVHLAQTDIRDRIARQLDLALFDSVISSSVRALATCESFPRLFDLFSQFVCRVTTYRWLAVAMDEPPHLAVHCHPLHVEASVSAAKEALSLTTLEATVVEDEDASDLQATAPLLLHEVVFGSSHLGKLAVQPVDMTEETGRIMQLIANELGGPLRIVALVEESRRLAEHDPLTGIMNRRAFMERVGQRIAASHATTQPLSCVLLDLDHFKAINDTYGHKMGDRVLSYLGPLARRAVPPDGDVARWGGEEFVISLPGMSIDRARAFAESFREQIESSSLQADDGRKIPLTASLGVVELVPNETFESLVERADQAMYSAKLGGRNRVALGGLSDECAPSRPSLRARAAVA